MDLPNLFQRGIKYKKPIDEQLVTKLTDYLQSYYKHLSKHGHFMPFYSLYKSELLDLAHLLKIEDQFLTPTSYQDLLYPDNIALSWDKMDPILFLLTEKQLTPEQISQDLKVDLQWLKKLKSHIDKESLKATVSQFII